MSFNLSQFASFLGSKGKVTLLAALSTAAKYQPCVDRVAAEVAKTENLDFNIMAADEKEKRRRLAAAAINGLRAFVEE